MARPRRVIVPNEPHHVTQRGNNRQRMFLDEEDHLRYLAILQKESQKEGIQIPAFCLMPNHVHEIFIPPTEDSLPKMMQEVQSTYARGFSRKYQRSGHAWQGRYFSCPLGPEHLYRAIRYVEMNPVRAGMVSEAWEHPWSSAAFHLGLVEAAPSLKVAPLNIGFDTNSWDAYLKGREGEEDRMFIRASTSRGLRWETAAVPGA